MFFRLVAVSTASICILFGAAAAATVASAEPPLQGQVQQGSIHSEALRGTLHFEVWLPPGYALHPAWHYPVLYVLHGLPGGASSYRALAFLVPILNGLQAQAIVVFPQGARAGDRDDEYLDLGPGRDWTVALTRELPRAVDSRYRTIPTREGRGIIGISAGGYGAVILGLHNLARYSVIESWSGYFHATTPDGRAPMRLPPKTAEWADAHALVPQLPAEITTEPTVLAFYIGNADPYPSFLADNEQFDQELTKAGIAHTFALYSGGHGFSLWLAHAASWLELALQRLAPAGGVPQLF